MFFSFFGDVGAGEANFLMGVAKKHGVKDFDVVLAKKRFFQIYVEKVLSSGFSM